MNQLRNGALLLIALFLLGNCSSKEEKKFMTRESVTIVSKEITYRSKNKKMKGFLAIPTGEGPFPGVLVVHEWWGQNEYPRERARMLARQGFVALAVDMYGDGQVVEHPKDAQQFSKQVMSDLDEAEENFTAALDELKKHPQVNPKQTAALGYCFGGGIVLEMARRGADLDMVASYHGGLTPLVKNDVPRMKTRLLIFNGGSDPMVKKEDIVQARKNLKASKVRYKFVNYKGAKHAFTNPEATANGKKFDLPLEYNPKADQDSWQKTLDAFKIVFK